jgi:hypothetical protein
MIKDWKEDSLMEHLLNHCSVKWIPNGFAIPPIHELLHPEII